MLIDYKECKATSDACRSSMFEFPDVDNSRYKLEASISSFAKLKDPLHDIENRDEVAEALGANGF